MEKRILLAVVASFAVLACVLSVTFLSRADNRSNLDYEDFWRREGRLPMKALLDSGNRMLHAGDPERALAYYHLITSQAHDNLPKDELYTVTRAFNNAGYIYFFNLSDYKEAFDRYISALSLAEDNKLDSILPFVLTNIGNVYYVYGQKERAMEYFHKAFRTSVSTGETNMLLTSLNNMLLYAFDTGTADSIAEDLRVFDTLHLGNDRYVCDTRRLVKSLRALARNDVAGSLALLDSAVTETGVREKVRNISIRTSLFYRLGRYREALDECRRLRQYTEIPGATDVKVGWLSSMAGIHEALGNIDSAYSYAQQHIGLSDSIFGRRVYGEIRDLEASRHLKTADTKFRQLQHAHSVMKLELISAMVIMVLLVAIVIVTITGRRRLRRRNEDLFRRNSELMAAEEQMGRWRRAYEQVASHSREKRNEHPKPMDSDESTASECPDRYIDLAARISRILDENPQVYYPNFTIDDLARLAGEPKQVVSSVLNRILGKTFPQILGEVRVKEACRRLSDREQSERLTLEGVAESCGFKSRTNFISVFKKATGLTPSQYRDMARAEKTVDVSI